MKNPRKLSGVRSLGHRRGFAFARRIFREYRLNGPTDNVARYGTPVVEASECSTIGSVVSTASGNVTVNFVPRPRSLVTPI